MAATWTGHFVDGFDHLTAADVPKKYFSGSGGTKVVTADTRHIYGEAVKGISGLQVSVPNSPTFRWAGAIQRGALTDEAFLQFHDTTIQMLFEFKPNGDIKVWRGAFAALLGTASAVIPAATWVWVEILLTIHDSAGVVLIFVSDTTTPVLSLTGQDTQATGNTQASIVQMGLGDNTFFVDDAHVSWGTGTVVAGDALPDSRVITPYALTQGDHSDFTPNSGSNHVDRVRDDPTADGDSTYLSSNAAGDRESMLTDDLPVDVDVINFVQVTAVTRKDDASSRTCTLFTRRNANDTDDPGGAQNVLDTYRALIFCQDEDPETSTAWVAADVNDTQVGYELTS